MSLEKIEFICKELIQKIYKIYYNTTILSRLMFFLLVIVNRKTI